MAQIYESTCYLLTLPEYLLSYEGLKADNGRTQTSKTFSSFFNFGKFMTLMAFPIVPKISHNLICLSIGENKGGITQEQLDKAAHTLKFLIVSFNFTLTPDEKQHKKQGILSKLMVLHLLPEGPNQRLGPALMIWNAGFILQDFFGFQQDW